MLTISNQMLMYGEKRTTFTLPGVIYRSFSRVINWGESRIRIDLQQVQ